MSVRSTQLWSMAMFEHKHFTRKCGDAFKGWWDILLSVYYKFTAKSVGKRIFENRSAFGEVSSKNIVSPFSGHGVYSPTTGCERKEFFS